MDDLIARATAVRDAVRAGTHPWDIRKAGEFLDGKYDQDFIMGILDALAQSEARATDNFTRMREWMNASYHLRYPVSPEVLGAVAERIDCGDDCDNAWREWDTGVTGCTKSDTEEGCPFEHACALRDFAKALRTQAAEAEAIDWKSRAEAAEARVGELEAQLEAVPNESGGFVGDIFYGDPKDSTRGTHRWTGEEWERLPDEAVILLEFLAKARGRAEAAEARVAELEGQVEEARAIVELLARSRRSHGYVISVVAELDRLLNAFLAKLEGETP